MTPDTPKLTYLLRDRERRIKPPAPVPPLHEVREPGPRFARVRRFFRPWRLIGKLTFIGLPCWVTAGVLAASGWTAGALSGLIESLTSVAEAGMSGAAFMALLPVGILALWAGILAVIDATKLPEQQKMQRDYNDAAARLGQPDILTPQDMRRQSVREALTMLAHMKHMLDELSRTDRPFSGVLLDSLRESQRLMERSVLELVTTERQIAEWSGRLGEGAGYPVQLQQRRQQLLASYPEIIDRCLKATDQALAKQAIATGETGANLAAGASSGGDLKDAVDDLLARCQRAIDKVDATAYDEQEFLRYAAQEADAGTAQDTSPQTPEHDKQRES